MTISVSKRYFITLPDGIADALDQWAESERNKPSTLAAFLVERAVRDKLDADAARATSALPNESTK